MIDKPRTTVRELRKNLAAILASRKITTIGDHYKLRAFVVSIPPHDSWESAERKKLLKAAKRAIRAAIDAELD